MQLKFLRNSLLAFGFLGAITSLGFAADCEETNCSSFRIGVGGAYHTLDGKEASISSTGGYLSFAARGILKQRLMSELSGKVGVGSAKASESYFATLDEKPLSVFTEASFKIGLNISSKQLPLFVNAVYGWDNFSTNTKDKGIGLSRELGGVEIEGFLPTRNNSKIEYLVGYYHFFAANYLLQNDVSSKLGGTNYMIKASLGYASNITPNLGFYIKAIGKYENMSASKLTATSVNYPASTNYVGMIELGFEL
ncbi:hypothetical protein [Helicobacter japonicus]|uniref:hypothetical protein n=1 Tax=Helicobacter japonicus TaxID=425400 RepID=UPI00259B9005|nr:hypothetical protein [Helicobacter japonicus]